LVSSVHYRLLGVTGNGRRGRTKAHGFQTSGADTRPHMEMSNAPASSDMDMSSSPPLSGSTGRRRASPPRWCCVCLFSSQKSVLLVYRRRQRCLCQVLGIITSPTPERQGGRGGWLQTSRSTAMESTMTIIRARAHSGGVYGCRQAQRGGSSCLSQRHPRRPCSAPERAAPSNSPLPENIPCAQETRQTLLAKKCPKLCTRP
jgi:hypothetical protein